MWYPSRWTRSTWTRRAFERLVNGVRWAWYWARAVRGLLVSVGVGLVVAVVAPPIVLLVFDTGRLLFHEIDVALAAKLADMSFDYADLRNLALVVGAAVGAPFVVWRSWIAHRQTVIADSAAITNRFTQAVAQLGAEKTAKRPVRDPDTGAVVKDGRGVPVVEEVTEANLEVRIGGLYALERIAQDSERDHIPIMETLCAYVRQNAPARRPAAGMRNPAPNDESAEGDGREASKDDFRSDGKVEPIGPRIDIQTALTVIARRSFGRIAFERHRAQPYHLDLHSTDLRAADLSRARLEGATLYSADLRLADLGAADLGAADLRGADLRGTSLVFADLCDAKLEEAKLSTARLEDADLRNADLRSAMLDSAHLDNANLQGADVSKAKMEGADLGGAKLVSVNLNGAVLERAELDDADLNDANLNRANLKAADLRGAILLRSNLRKTMAYGAIIQRSLLASADCTGSTLEQAQIDSAFGDGGTILPEGVDRPAHWPAKKLSNAEALRAWKKWKGQHTGA